MSYDISLVVDVGGPDPLRVGDLDWNYTYNIQPMLALAGIPSLTDFDGKTAEACIPQLTEAIRAMESYPPKYRALNPPNGWGDYDGFLPCLRELLTAFEAAPKATVDVS